MHYVHINLHVAGALCFTVFLAQVQRIDYIGRFFMLHWILEVDFLSVLIFCVNHTGRYCA